MTPGPSALAQLVDGRCDDALLEVALDALARRRLPLSLPNLCNLLWFERGEEGGHDGPVFDAYWSSVARVAHDGERKRDVPYTPLRAVPLGAIVAVKVGSDEAWGEIVWKEGAHPALEEGWIPGWLSGAPHALPLDGPPPADLEPPSGERRLRERMVVDFSCLGAGLEPRPEALARLIKRQQADRYGHFIAEVAYEDGLDELDEVAFWAQWTVEHHSEALMAASVPLEAAALREAASVLAGALRTRDDVRSFGPYVLSEALYRSVLTEDRRDADALSRCVRSLARLPHHENVAFTALSSRLSGELPTEALTGTNWPLLVVVSSLRALEVLAEEAPDGDWAGVHLRLDDPWQGGGIWRTEALATSPAINEDPAIALGLGWLAYTGVKLERSADTGALEDDNSSEEPVAEITGSEVTWSVHLRPIDIDEDRLQVPAQVAELIGATLWSRGQERVVVAFRHDGGEERRTWCTRDERGHLFGVEWPLAAWAGTTVRCSWSLDATVVRAETHLLEEPEELGGLTYTHEFNHAVALAAAGVVPRTGATTSLGQLVRAAVRRHGALTEDGDACLPIEDVITCCFGPDGAVVPGFGKDVLRRGVETAVRAMAAAGLGRLEGDLVIVSMRQSVAGRRADDELLRRFAVAAGHRLRREARRHAVAPSVVNLPEGHHRSEEKDAGWAEVAGSAGLPDGVLESHQTWRKAHVRRTAVDQALEAELERYRHAFDRLGVPETVLENFHSVLDLTAPDADDALTGEEIATEPALPPDSSSTT